jgi:hypothetical protein
LNVLFLCIYTFRVKNKCIYIVDKFLNECVIP